MTSSTNSPESRYEDLLRRYCKNGGEEELYEASLLSQEFIAAGLPPDEIVAMHSDTVERVINIRDTRAVVASQQLLLELMIAYGVKYQQHAEMRLAEANREAELQNARALHAEENERARLELLAGIAHELGTPLTIISGNISAINALLRANDELEAEFTSRAFDAERALNRIVALARDLMAASRQEAPKIDLVPVHLGHSVEQAIRWSLEAATEKGIELVCSSDAEDPFILASEESIQTILGNLLSNAIRYTPSGGHVQVRCTREGDRLCVDVVDDGIGLSEADHERLFERFYRAEKARNLVSFGLGLGLSLTRDLVTSLQGTIEARSNNGSGTTFHVTFPAMAVEEES